MKNRIMQITAIISAISCMTACAAQTTSTVSEVTASTTVQTTPTPQETKKPLAETAQTTTTAQPETKAPQTAVTTTTSQTTSTPQETKAPETVVTTTTTTVQTTPAPQWNEEQASGTKYVNTDCYSRKKAVLGAETVKLYSVNEKVTVTAKTDTGYYKLDTGAYIHGDYLSDSRVTVQTITTTATQKTETKKPAQTTPKPQETKAPKPTAPQRVAYTKWTREECEELIERVYAWADEKGYKYNRVSDITIYGKGWYDEEANTLRQKQHQATYGEVYKHSSWHWTYKTADIEGDGKSYVLCTKEEIYAYMCDAVENQNERGYIPCIDYTYFNEYAEYAKTQQWGFDYEWETSTFPSDAVVFICTY